MWWINFKKGCFGVRGELIVCDKKNEEELTCQVSLMVTAEYSVDSYSSDDIEKNNESCNVSLGGCF